MVKPDHLAQGSALGNGTLAILVGECDHSMYKDTHVKVFCFSKKLLNTDGRIRIDRIKKFLKIQTVRRYKSKKGEDKIAPRLVLS